MDDSRITLAGDGYLIQTHDVAFLSLHRPPSKRNCAYKVNLRRRLTADSLIYRSNCSLKYRAHAQTRVRIQFVSVLGFPVGEGPVLEKRRNGDAAQGNNIGLCIRGRRIGGQRERKHLSLPPGMGGAADKNASSEE